MKEPTRRPMFGLRSSIMLIGSLLGDVFGASARSIRAETSALPSIMPQEKPKVTGSPLLAGHTRSRNGGGYYRPRTRDARRERNDIYAALKNYSGWCGHDRADLLARYASLS